MSAVALSLVSSLGYGYCPGSDDTLPNYDPAYYSVRKEAARSMYVVVARVESEVWLGEDGKPKALAPPFQNGGARPSGLDPYAGALYKLRISHSYKGSAPSTLTLFSENTTARFGLEVGAEYILFVSRSTFEVPVGQQLTIDTCGNSTVLKNASKTLALLDQSEQEPQK